MLQESPISNSVFDSCNDFKKLILTYILNKEPSQKNIFQQRFGLEIHDEKNFKISLSTSRFSFHALYLEFDNQLKEETKTFKKQENLNSQHLRRNYFISNKKFTLPNQIYLIVPRERYFRRHFLKLVEFRNIYMKQIEILSTVIYLNCYIFKQSLSYQ